MRLGLQGAAKGVLYMQRERLPAVTPTLRGHLLYQWLTQYANNLRHGLPTPDLVNRILFAHVNSLQRICSLFCDSKAKLSSRFACNA